MQLSSVTIKAFPTAHCSSCWSTCNYILPYLACGMLVSYNFHITLFSLFKQNENLRIVWLGWNWKNSRFGIVWKSGLFPFLHQTKKLLLKKMGDFWSRWRHRQTWLASLHNHNKITTKMYNNHHSEPSEIELNGSQRTTELKKPHPSRLIGGAKMPNGLVPHSCVVDKSLGGISQEQGVPAPHYAP